MQRSSVIFRLENNFEGAKTIDFDTEDVMFNEKNKMYFTVSVARKISFRAHVRSLGEEIKKRKKLRKVEGLGCKISMQLLEMKAEVRYLNLVRAYLKGIEYKVVEKSTSEQKKVSAPELTRLVKHFVSPWQEKFHTEEALTQWISPQ